jgi:hypothetical protein
MPQQNAFMMYDKKWVAKVCPHCNQEPAVAHAWLFKEAASHPVQLQPRKPSGEVFLHDEREDCVVLASGS